MQEKVCKIIRQKRNLDLGNFKPYEDYATKKLNFFRKKHEKKE
jgi:hypothetical protein